MDNETIDFILKALDWAEQGYEQNSAKYRFGNQRVPGYETIYKDTKSKYENARQEMRRLKT